MSYVLDITLGFAIMNWQ